MPRSKREKEVSLTKVKKKTRATKEALVDEIRQSVDKYQNVLVFTIENMRSKKFIATRQQFKDSSRFFFGKNNVMGIALGRTQNDEHASNLHKISETLKGQCGLMFTDLPVKNVINQLNELKEADFARAGDIAPETIELPEGLLPQFAFSMEPQLRKLGMPTKLDKGAVALYQAFEVCREGEPISVDQAKILKLLEIKLSHFQIKIIAQWNLSKGFKSLE